MFSPFFLSPPIFFSHFTTIFIVFEQWKMPAHRPVSVGLVVILLGLNQFILDWCIGLTATNSYDHPATLAPAEQLYWTELSRNYLRVSAFHAERILQSNHFSTDRWYIRGVHACSVLTPHACTSRGIANGKCDWIQIKSYFTAISSKLIAYMNSLIVN